MERNKDDPRQEFEQLMYQEKRLIRLIGRGGRHGAKHIKEPCRIQARRAEIGHRLNIGLLKT